MPAHRSRRSRPAATALVSMLVGLGLLAPGIPASAAATPIEAPVITAPLAGASSVVEPELTWTGIYGAGHYAVQVAADGTFADPVYDVITSNTAATPELDLDPGTWHWRVAMDEGGARGPWAVSTFVKAPSLAAPVQVTPADGAAFEHPAVPVLAWTPVGGAASYEVQLADNPALGDPFPALTRTTQLVATFALPGVSYSWRVRAVARNGVATGPWSAVRSFSAASAGVPTGLEPRDGAAVRDIEVAWDPMPGAAGYDVEVTPGPDPDWGAAAARSYATTATRFLVEDPVVPAGTTLAWRVRAVSGNPADPPGPWTAPRLVTRTMSDPPMPLAPADGTVTGAVVTLAWTPSLRASHYAVQVSADAGFGTGVADYATTEPALDVTTAEQIAPYVLVKGTTYHWRVRGIDTDIVHLPGLPASGWSVVRTFTWDPPVATLLVPADGEIVHVPTLAWNAAGGHPMRVTVEDAGGDIVARRLTWAGTYTPEAPLDPSDGPFTWYVERVALPGGDADTVAWRSAERSFSIQPITPTAAAPDPAGPPDGSHSLVTPTLSWTPVVGADHYRVYRGLPDVLPDDLENSWSPALTFPVWTYPTGDLDAHQHTWVVLAFDAAGDVVARGAPSTFVLDRLPAPEITSPADCVAAGCAVYADTPRLSWQPVTGATGYTVGYRGTGGGMLGAATPGTSIQPIVDILGPVSGSPAGSAEWDVSACVEQRCSDGATHLFLLTLPAPLMISPAEGEIVAGPQVTLAWKDLLQAPATTGSIGTPRTEAFAYHPALIGSPENGTASQLGGAPTRTWVLPPGTWTWELWAHAGSGRPTAHASRSITIEWAGPNPVNPPSGTAVAQTPLLAWVPAAFSDTYEVEVFAGTAAVPAARVLQATTHEAAYAPFDELAAGTYTWHVRSILSGSASSWGAPATFTIGPPAAAVLLQPASGEVSATGIVQFAWGTVAGAAAYRLQADDDASFGSPRESVVTGQRQWAPLGAYPSGTWLWRVQALGPSGAVLATSPARQVIVDLAVPVVSSPVESIARARASTGAAVPVDLTWEGSDTQAGEVRYDMRRSVDGGPFAAWATGVTRATARGTLAPGHTYRFAVQAIDPAGHRSAWAYGRTFRVKAYADGASAVTYRGSWHISRSSRYVGRSTHWSTAAGARATFRFTGRRVAWVAAVGPGRGKARIYVDGRLATTVNLHATAPGTRRVVFTRSWASAGSHAVRVEVVGTPKHARVDVDGFVVIR